MDDLKKTLFQLWLVRAVVGSCVLLRGLLFMLVDQFKGISDLCWVCRVSGVGPLRAIAYSIVVGFVSVAGAGENRLVKAFLKSKAPARSKKRFLGAGGDLGPVFRDFIVVKPPLNDEKGVLLLEYSQKFDLFIALFDLNQIMKDYYVVLEPCWAGYCDPSILMFISSSSEVIVQCPERSDFDFIAGLKSNLVPIDLGSSDWIDSELFAPRQENVSKEYDLIMVANWGKHKNHRQLFRALRHVKHRPLSIVLIGGDCAGRTAQDVALEMQQYNLSDVTMEMRQNIPAPEVADCLKKAKVFLLLSEKEGSNRAIVEALFSDVPAILYEEFIGGARGKINQQTGVLSSFAELPRKIDYVLDHYRRFSPRAWALEHTGSKNATNKLNSLLKSIAVSKGEKWSTDIVGKINNPNFSYKVKDAIPRSQQASAIAKVYFRLCVLLLIGTGCLASSPALDATSLSVKGGVSDGILATTMLPSDGLGPTPGSKGAVLFDNFEYEVGRSEENAEVAFRAHGWTDVKANNSYYRRGAGFLYTQPDSVLGSRVLVMESRPSMAEIPPGFRASQTDYYLKFGQDKASQDTIPSNLWVQFWTYATHESRFARRDKTIYPCRESYPCQRGQLGWLFMWGSAGYETISAPNGGRFLALEGEHADFRGADEYPTNARKLFQNVSRAPLLADRWYQVKLHIDVSRQQGVYEAWVRERGLPWKKVAEWIGGVTRDFAWPILEEERLGFKQLAMPTTVSGPADSTTYMDDFVLAGSEDGLP